MSVSRNAPCPCGSGRKYKLCCLPARELVRRVAHCEERVGERIRRWAKVDLRAEVTLAMREVMLDVSSDPTEHELFDSWFHSDRLLATDVRRRSAMPSATTSTPRNEWPRRTLRRHGSGSTG